MFQHLCGLFVHNGAKVPNSAFANETPSPILGTKKLYRPILQGNVKVQHAALVNKCPMSIL